MLIIKLKKKFYFVKRNNTDFTSYEMNVKDQHFVSCHFLKQSFKNTAKSKIVINPIY